MSVLREYAHIVTDPAHIFAEITFLIIIDGLTIGLLYNFVLKKALHRREERLHKLLDAEHGYTHD